MFTNIPKLLPLRLGLAAVSLMAFAFGLFSILVYSGAFLTMALPLAVGSPWALGAGITLLGHSLIGLTSVTSHRLQRWFFSKERTQYNLVDHGSYEDVQDQLTSPAGSRVGKPEDTKQKGKSKALPFDMSEYRKPKKLAPDSKFSSVTLMEHSKTRQKIVIKELLKFKDESVFKNEKKVFQHLGKHAHIVTLLHTQDQPPRLILEFMDKGALSDFLIEKPVSNEIYKRYHVAIARDIARGLAYMHAKYVMHCDIKSRNILLTGEHYTAKLCDFGTATLLDQGQERKDMSYVGMTTLWMAPEVARCFCEIREGRCKTRMVNYSYAADVYSFAMVIKEILTRKWPYAKEYERNRIVAMVKDFSHDGDNLIPDNSSEILTKIVKECLTDWPDQRPTMAAVTQFFSAEQPHAGGSSSVTTSASPVGLEVNL